LINLSSVEKQRRTRFALYSLNDRPYIVLRAANPGCDPLPLLELLVVLYHPSDAGGFDIPSAG